MGCVFVCVEMLEAETNQACCHDLSKSFLLEEAKAESKSPYLLLLLFCVCAFQYLRTLAPLPVYFVIMKNNSQTAHLKYSRILLILF